MSGTRPFDDGRWPDQEGYAECFLCGKPVDPRDPNRGDFAEGPTFTRLPLHIPCLNGRDMVLGVSVAYHVAINQMADRQIAIALGR